MPGSNTPRVPAAVGGYTVIDGRQTHRCTVCGAYVETRDKPRHNAHHRLIADLHDRLTRLENPTDTLPLDNEPPF